MSVQVSVFQFQGLRERQEDHFVILQGVPSRIGLICAVGAFDGVGSALDGDLASAVAAAGFRQAVYKFAFMRDPVLTPRELIENAFRGANEAVLRLRRQDVYAGTQPALRPAAVGAAVGLFPSFELVIAQVGDVHAFLERDAEVIQLTEAHHAADDGPGGDEPGAVTRYFGQEDIQPQILTGQLNVERDDALWLMTDGAYGRYQEAAPPTAPRDYFSAAAEQDFWDNATAIELVSLPRRAPLRTCADTAAVPPPHRDTVEPGPVA